LKAKGYFNIPYVYSCLGSQNHGFVVTQSPGGGSEAATGTAISLRLEGENCRLVPNVRNLTLARAAGLLKSAGFENIPYVYKCLGSDLFGEVEIQSPGPGADIVATNPVHLVLQADGCAGGAGGRGADDGPVAG
jgi:beta-lactam-binding protein with PASTA domain